MIREQAIMLRLIRSVLRMRQPIITRERAIEIAILRAEELRWPVEKPEAVERLMTWLVWLTPDRDPCAYMYIHNQSGKVLRTCTLPR